MNAANAECEGRQHTNGSKRSYMSSPFVEKTGNARKKRWVTGSVGIAFVMCYLCSTKVVNETVNPKCLTIECLIGIGMKLSACYEACLWMMLLHILTIFRLKRKLNQTGDVVDLQRTGRPKKTTAGEDRHLRTLHLKNRFRSACETARNWTGNERISLHTVLRRLKNAGLRSQRPVQKQMLNQRHIAARLAWATRHRRQTIMQWSRIIWSDEKVFHVDKKDSRICCFRRQNERFQQPNIRQYGPRQSIMVLAAISAEGKSQIIRFNGNVTAIRYQNEALGPALLPFLNSHMPQMQFMQDIQCPSPPCICHKRLATSQQCPNVWPLAR